MRWNAHKGCFPKEATMNDIESEAAPLRQTEVKGPSEMAAEELRVLTDSIVAALKTVYDPEIPADIYELGLIYNVDVDESRFVTIEMTLTAPACPVAGEMPSWVENAIGAVPGVAGAKVNMVFDPAWDQSRMSDEARAALDMW
jgi:FeS assembly SUF system protein